MVRSNRVACSVTIPEKELAEIEAAHECDKSSQITCKHQTELLPQAGSRPSLNNTTLRPPHWLIVTVIGMRVEEFSSKQGGCPIGEDNQYAAVCQVDRFDDCFHDAESIDGKDPESGWKITLRTTIADRRVARETASLLNCLRGCSRLISAASRTRLWLAGRS